MLLKYITYFPLCPERPEETQYFIRLLFHYDTSLHINMILKTYKCLHRLLSNPCMQYFPETISFNTGLKRAVLLSFVTTRNPGHSSLDHDNPYICLLHSAPAIRIDSLFIHQANVYNSHPASITSKGEKPLAVSVTTGER